MRLKTNIIRNTAIKLWLAVTVALLCLIVGAKPVQAYDNQAFLRVNGNDIVKEGELIINKVNGVKGTAVYDEKTNTLTLTNFVSTTGVGSGIAFQYMGDLTIVLKGTNTLNVAGEGIGMRQPKDDADSLLICGGGTLNISAGSWEKAASGINIDNAGLTIEDCTMNISASYGSFGVAKDLTIKNSNIKVVRTGYGVVNDPNQNNNIYNERHAYPAVSVYGMLVMENSTLDATGINFGIMLDKIPVFNGKVSVTDENGTALNLVKLHIPLAWMNGYTESFNYAYSTSTAEDVYYFDETPNRVIIKALNEANKPTGNGTTNGGSIEIGEGEKCWTINNAYYVGKASTGKVSYAGPVNKNVTKITIPPTVTVDGKVCKVTSIQKSACKDCKKLKTVTIGKNVTTIGEKAFYNCKKLKTVTLGSKVKTIGQKSFYKCSALTKIILPASITTIKAEAFGKCTKLGSVTIKGKKLKTVGANAFKNTKKKIKITVPKSKYKSYKSLLKGKGLKSPVYKKK